MTPKPSCGRLSALPARVRPRSSAPHYPALLCLVMAGASAGCSDGAWPDDPTDAAGQADSSYTEPDAADAQAADSSGDDADSGWADAGPAEDEVQMAGCSATMYQAGPARSPGSGAAVIAAVIALGARGRRRRAMR